MYPGMTYQFAQWAGALRADDIPPDVSRVAQRAMLDTLAVMIAGGAHEDTQKLAGLWPDTSGHCGLSTGGMAGAETAALINGNAAHFWDFDDTSYTGIMHGSALVFPVVLALAQETGASDDAARTAFIIGSEITYVLADICTQKHYFHGWWSTVTFGLVGASAAAARLLGCTTDQMAQVIGLAAAAAGGGKSVLGTHAKPFLVGDAARRAIGFARFVAAGLSGPDDGLESPTGFLHLLGRGLANLDEVETLGRRWRLSEPGLLFKLNPVCSAAHAAIEGISRLSFDDDLNHEDIETIRVDVPKLVRISLIHDNPKTPAEAQFSLPFAAACAVLNGAVRLNDLNAAFIASPCVASVMAKVQIFEAADLSSPEALARHPESARVMITLKDKSVRQRYCGEAYGMPGNPLSDADFLKKFHACLGFAKCAADVTNISKTAMLPLAADLMEQVTAHTNAACNR